MTRRTLNYAIIFPTGEHPCSIGGDTDRVYGYGARFKANEPYRAIIEMANGQGFHGETVFNVWLYKPQLRAFIDELETLYQGMPDEPLTVVEGDKQP